MEDLLCCGDINTILSLMNPNPRCCDKPQCVNSSHKKEPEYEDVDIEEEDKDDETNEEDKKDKKISKRKDKLCLKCDTYACFGFPGQIKAIYCDLHKEKGMINVRTRNKCEDTDCQIQQPCFNYSGETRGIYCFNHKKDGMINVKSKKCLKCDVRPNFNFVGNKTGLYCELHKEDGMVNVTYKRCDYLGCNAPAIYNVDGQKYGICCLDHIKDGMIKIVRAHRQCTFPECKTSPKFNYVGETVGIWCAEHREECMVDVVSKRCNEPGCISPNPAYNMPGKKIGIWCIAHKKEGMIYVIGQRCLMCDTFPSYNFIGIKQGIYCLAHKKPGMINVKNKQCLYPECGARPIYNFDGNKQGKFCWLHKYEGMIDVISNRCLEYLCYTRVHNLKYDGYCRTCFINNSDNLTKPAYRNYKTKELDVITRIRQLFPDVDWRADKRVLDGCSRRRPDLLLDMGSHVIIIEIDENKHETYDTSCEHKRIMQIWQDINGSDDESIPRRPVVFVRFNPDAYVNENGIKITSCWSSGKSGLISVPRNKLTEWNQRLDALSIETQYWKTTIPTKTVEIVYLFYGIN